jgi:hypothetical protein
METFDEKSISLVLNTTLLIIITNSVSKLPLEERDTEKTRTICKNTTRHLTKQVNKFVDKVLSIEAEHYKQLGLRGGT